MPYPDQYTALDRESFLARTPDNKTVVIFIHGNVATDLDDKPSFERAQTVLPRYPDYLSIDIDDVVEHDMTAQDNEKYHFLFFSLAKAYQIDKFLRQHADKRVIATCVAGVSRSGGVVWYLDSQNDRTNRWWLSENTNQLRSMKYAPNQDMYVHFAELLELQKFASQVNEFDSPRSILDVYNEPAVYPMLYRGLYGADSASGAFSKRAYTDYTSSAKRAYTAILDEITGDDL